MINFDLTDFIKNKITKRKISMFSTDIYNNKSKLNAEIEGQNILVIGGAGTIGSNFIKEILQFYPHSLTVVDYSENGLTELTRDLRSQNIFIPREYTTYPFDFGSNLFEKLMKSRSFDIIACFAAHKHVRSEKNLLSIEAMVRNNVFNTKSLLSLASSHNVKHFFVVSTDKAANPVNVMGASKRLMEELLMSYAKEFKITAARFANVAFSNGSLLEGYIHRLMKRQPLVAPTDIKRYFLSPKESGQLCLLACILGKSGEIFFPKLSEDQMMSFSEILLSFLEELKLTPNYCKSEKEAILKARDWDIHNSSYPIYLFDTDTSGEKPYEEFYEEGDVIILDEFMNLGTIKRKSLPVKSVINQYLALIDKSFTNSSNSKEQIVNILTEILPGFSHTERGKNLDQKM